MRAWMVSAVALALLGGCVTREAPAPMAPPVGLLPNQACAAAPDLDGAVSLGFGGAPLDLALGEGTGCIETPEGRSTYVALRLPQRAAPYAVTVSTVPQGDLLFSPRLRIFDADRHPVRQVTRNVFEMQRRTLSATIDVGPGDRWLVIASDPASVGREQREVIASAMEAGSVAGGFGVPTVRAMSQTASYTNTDQGPVTVQARPR